MGQEEIHQKENLIHDYKMPKRYPGVTICCAWESFYSVAICKITIQTARSYCISNFFSSLQKFMTDYPIKPVKRLKGASWLGRRGYTLIVKITWTIIILSNLTAEWSIITVTSNLQFQVMFHVTKSRLQLHYGWGSDRICAGMECGSNLGWRGFWRVSIPDTWSCPKIVSSNFWPLSRQKSWFGKKI